MALIWRDTALKPKILFIDATAGPVFLIWALHMRWWTFWTTLTLIAILAILPLFGLTPKKLFHIAMMRFIGGGRIHCGTPMWRYARRSRY